MDLDPITIGMSVIGLGMQLFGGFAQADNAQEQAKVSADQAQQEQSINNLKQQAMEMDAKRQRLEIFRKGQQAASLGEARAVNQGAQFGSGIKGGLGEIFDQTLFNAQGVNNALETGRGINSFNQNISADRIRMAQLGGEAATDQGISTIGGALIKAGPISGQISKGFGTGFNGFGSLFGGGSPSGYGIA